MLAAEKKVRKPRGKRARSPAKPKSKDIGGKQKKVSSVRIVAIGASAGGLDPYEKFFDAMPTESGLAFVVVQHLSPDFRSMMDELLARHTTMSIYRVEDGMTVEPNAIYLNPPRSVMVMQDGKFLLKETPEHESLNLPINTFFESLAIDQGVNAIGVVLSGTGSDGTIGCGKIKGVGGAVFVQDPETAKFDGMLNSVINEGFADLVASPAGLAKGVSAHIKGERIGEFGASLVEYSSPLEAILGLLRERIGTDFSMYKKLTIERRIRRRAEMRGENDLTNYLDRLISDAEELSALYNDLLIEVTSFFRDAEAFKVLEKEVIPKIAAKMSASNQIRVWVPGCASGEEAYSIAILFADYAADNDVPLNLKILATDIHTRSLDAASSGVYTPEALKSLSSDRVARHFSSVGEYYQIQPRLRRMVVFSPHSLLADPPFTRMDLVSCRNVLIYFNDVAQRKALSLFHFSLTKGGFLFLGPSETVGPLDSEFDMIHQRWRIFRKNRDVRLIESSALLHGNGSGSVEPSVAQSGQSFEQSASGLRPAARRAYNDALTTLLTKYAPTGFLLSRNGELVHIFGDAGSFIKLDAGGFSFRIIDLVHEHLKLAVGLALERMKTPTHTDFRRTVQFDSGGKPETLNVGIERLPDPSGNTDFLLLTIERAQRAHKPSPTDKDFTPIVASEEASVLNERIGDLERDLASTEESLQATIEELETSNEELQATNEELMASNEELQSTNEELHSVNEELYTVSAEHQRKIEELTELTSDMDHLLKSTEIGTVFLDSGLRIRRFTPAANETFNLINQDVGRPISHVTYKFKEDDLNSALDESRRTGKLTEREIDVDGNAFLLRVLPFLDDPEETSGIVITVINVQALKEARNAVTRLADMYAGILADFTEFVVRWDAEDGNIIYCNEAFAQIEGKSIDSLKGTTISDVMLESEQVRMDKALSRLSPGEATTMLLRHLDGTGETSWREVTIRAIGNESGVKLFQKTGHNATQSIRYLQALEALIDAPDGTPDEYLDMNARFLEIGQKYFGFEHALLTVVEDGKCLVETYSGASSSAFPLGEREDYEKSLCRITVSSAEVFHVPDISSSRQKRTSEHINLGVQSYIGCPIIIDSEVCGVLEFMSIDRRRVAPFLDGDKGFVRLMAQWMSHRMQRRQQLRALRGNEQELQRIFDHVPARIWYKDDKNNIRRLNHAAAESMGVTIEDAIGASVSDLLPAVSDQYFKDDLSAIESGEPLLGAVEEFVAPDRQRGWIRTDRVPYFSDNGDRNLLVVSQDVTELKTQEVQLRQLNTELDQQRAHYLHLYRNTPVMMQSINSDGTILEVSNNWLSKLGYERSAGLGCQTTEFMTKESRNYAEQVVFPQFWQTGACQEVSLKYKTKSGHTIDVELSGVSDDSERAANRGLGVLIDVTERNSALFEIERKNVELEQANDGLLQFAYVASHDLQEPLRKIRQFSEMLVSDFGDTLTEDGKYYLDVVAGSASRMSRLIRDLLNYSKTSNMGLVKSTVSLKDVVSSVATELEESISEVKGKVKISGLPTASCDRTMVEQLFTNLLANSLKYRREDVPLKIDISAVPKDGGVTVQVVDNGIGFAPEHTKRIFDPFARLHGAETFEGSGIGLAMCKAVCERHGWAIDGESDEEFGSKFSIHIPASELEAPK